MAVSPAFDGQWIGHFSYGPEYGEEVSGEKVTFRLFIDSFKDGMFQGKSVDLEGVGANFEVANVRGFLQDSFISFTKEYPHFYGIDERGNTFYNEKKAHPPVCYEGYYDERSKLFCGRWELEIDVELVEEGWRVELWSGTWELRQGN